MDDPAIIDQLRQQLGGVAYGELPVLTPTIGVRRPDVVWLPSDREDEVRLGFLLERAAPIVVEVLSPGNRRAEIETKVQAYLDWGVEEVIVVALDGAVRHHRKDGTYAHSALGLRLSLTP